MQLTLPAAYALVDSYLTTSERPTAIYAFNDEHALILLAALADRGIRVPHDIAIIGTDNIAFSDLCAPPSPRSASTTSRLASSSSICSWLNTRIKPLPKQLSRPLARSS